MKMSEFCPKNCKYLNITEEQQQKLQEQGAHRGHYCTKYNDTLYHMLAHPDLYKCYECYKENKNE